ncbi:hypothetical protein ABZ707_12655 [Streptomyces sp. NPDC006923]|uniref:hypothetical protein n=1 Tax=Streptomyces sp. NPDC006923 TaxID=3155355 RepID=UPI0033C0C6C7
MAERGSRREPGAEDEQELRILLERAVPRLPAPEGRLRQVRERAGRTRRRRRGAGAAALAVTGLVVAGTLLPDATRDDAGQVPPAASPPAAVPTVAATEPPATDAPAALVRFPDVAGLVLRLPEHWRALNAPGQPLYRTPARGFVSSQALTAYGPACLAKYGGDCLPVGTLAAGGALLTLVPVLKPGLAADEPELPLKLYASDALSPACRRIGGSTEYSGLFGGAPAPTTAVALTLCAASGASETVEEVRAMINAARFGDTGAPPAPGPTTTQDAP